MTPTDEQIDELLESISGYAPVPIFFQDKGDKNKIAVRQIVREWLGKLRSELSPIKKAELRHFLATHQSPPSPPQPPAVSPPETP